MRYGVLQDHLTTLEYDLLTTLSSEPLLRDTNKARAHASRMTDDDLRAQLSAGVIRRVYTAPSTLIKVFKIDKSNGKFSRLLGDGRPFDERTAKVPAPRLPTMAAIENFVREQAWASIRDFAGWFYQLPIKPSLSKHLGFRVRGLAGVEYYAFRVAIPGISRSATMAQVVTGGIRTMAGVSDDSLAIYDDVIIGGHDRLETSLRTVAFDSACAEAVAILRPDKCKSPAKVATFNGLELDLGAKTITLPKEWRLKLAQLEIPTPRSRRTLGSLLGCWRYVMYAMRLPAAAYPALVLAGRTLGKLCDHPRDWDRPVLFSQTARATYAHFQHALRSMQPRLVQVESLEWHVWADASDQGLAGFVIEPHARQCVARRSWTWTRALQDFAAPVPIRRRELLAMAVVTHAAVTLALQMGVRPRLVAYHDNTTAEARHRRWASPHVGENALLHQLHLRLVAAGLPPMHTVLVGTNDQLADAGTRGDPLF